MIGAVAVLGGASLLGACGSAPESADDILASAQSYVSDAEGFRFDAGIRSTYVVHPGDMTGEPTDSDPASVAEWGSDGPGTTTTDRTTITGVWTPGAWEARSEGSFGRSEAKGIATKTYVRGDTYAGSGSWEALDTPQPSRDDMLDSLRSIRDAAGATDATEDGGTSTGYLVAPGAATSLAASVYLGGDAWGGPDLLGDPTAFLAAVADLGDPAVASRDGATTTVAGDVSAPADVEDAWGAALPVGHVTLTVDDDGAPTRFTLSVSEGEDSEEISIAFSAWNEPQQVLPPHEDEIDRTPWIDEEAVAAVPGVTLVRPTALPDGWELDYVDVLSGDDTAEGCDQVELQWSPMISEEDWNDASAAPSDNFALYLMPAACALESDATPFEAGPFAPFPSRRGAFSVEVLVGDTVVQVDSTLTGSDLTALVTSLASTDVGALSAALADSGGQLLTS